MLGKLPVPGRPTNLNYSRARAYCACSRCGWGLFGLFFSHLSLLFSFSLSLGDDPILTEILSHRAVKPKTTNQQPIIESCTIILTKTNCKMNLEQRLEIVRESVALKSFRFCASNQSRM